MNIREALQKLDFGNSVAEYDKGLQNYFLVTQAYTAFIKDDADLIAGDKGTGKTAIFQQVRRNYVNEPAMAAIGIVTGFNLAGEPLFRKLGSEPILQEAQYVSIWKMYILSLIGNWLLNLPKTPRTASTQKLDALLASLGLRTEEEGASPIFSKVIDWALHLRPKVELSPDPTNPIGFRTSVEFYQAQSKKEPSNPEEISHTQALSLLNKLLVEQKKTAWVVIDRLDEAFIGFPAIEKPVLRALLRAYLDMMEFDHIRLKLFVRKDLFRKIIEDGFVNLTHINARKHEILWDDEDLLALFAQRVRSSQAFVQMFGIVNASDRELFQLILPEKIDAGKNRPNTWPWLLGQIRDGNGVKSPRNLVDLMRLAQEEQLRREQRSPRKYTADTPMIEMESLRKALVRLSQRRVEDTLLAEYGSDVRRAILAFKNGCSDYNEVSLGILFGVDAVQARSIADVLLEIGFLEQIGVTFKVPDLYRAGLNISNGKAQKGGI